MIEIRIEREPQNLVHINTVLVRADSAKEAYAKAVELGATEENTHENPDRRTVSATFRALHELSLIDEPLEHGTELFYKEKIGLTEGEVLELVRPGESLGVFREVEPSKGPNYMPKDIMDMLVERLGEDAMKDFLERGDRP